MYITHFLPHFFSVLDYKLEKLFQPLIQELTYYFCRVLLEVDSISFLGPHYSTRVQSTTKNALQKKYVTS